MKEKKEEEKKIICPYCESYNNINNIYCDKCRREIRKRRSVAWIFLFLFVILLLFYLVLDNLQLYTPVKRTELVNTPIIIIREVNSVIPFEKQVCQNRSYRFSTLGGNVDSIGQNVVPNLQITNLENVWGYFKVNFSYINDDDFSYDIYGGDRLKESLASGKISTQDAEFYSNNYDFYLGPGETLLISNRTKKPDLDAKYWAIATIIEPKILECTKKTEYRNITENKTFTEYKKETQARYVKEYRKLKEILGIKTFFDWFVIIFLLFLILILALKIREEKKRKKLVL